MADKITVYSTPTCPYCVRAKQFFKDSNVAFDDINVAVDHEKAQEMVTKSGQMGVPVIDVDGEIIIGFDKAKLQSLLGI